MPELFSYCHICLYVSLFEEIEEILDTLEDSDIFAELNEDCTIVIKSEDLFNVEELLDNMNIDYEILI